MVNGIQSARVKIERAIKHIEALQLCAANYTGQETNLVVDQSEGSEKLRFPNDPPIEIAILAGEIVYQLRSALDHLAFELVKCNLAKCILPKNWERDCYFPLCLAVPKKGNPPVPINLPLPFNFFKDSLPGITPDAFAVVERLQPYNGGNGPMQLGWLEKLANIDKHRHFHVVIPQIYQTEHIRSATLDSEMLLRLQDGAEIMPTLHDAEDFAGAVYVQRGIVYPFISFDESALPSDLADISIDNVLDLCADAISRFVIPAFEKVIKSP
jgi:hypothetical protein